MTHATTTARASWGLTLCLIRACGQCPSHKGHDRIRSGQNIRRREAQQAVTRIDQSILTPDGGGKDNIGVMGNGAQSVKAAAESAPTRTKEVVLGQPVPPSLLKIEGTRGERYRNQWSTRHGPTIVDKAASKCNSAREGQRLL